MIKCLWDGLSSPLCFHTTMCVWVLKEAHGSPHTRSHIWTNTHFTKHIYICPHIQMQMQMSLLFAHFCHSQRYLAWDEADEWWLVSSLTWLGGDWLLNPVVLSLPDKYQLESAASCCMLRHPEPNAEAISKTHPLFVCVCVCVYVCNLKKSRFLFLSQATLTQSWPLFSVWVSVSKCMWSLTGHVYVSFQALSVELKNGETKWG